MDRLAGKRLLVLGGAIQQAKVVAAARGMGVYVIVADVNKLAPAKAVADEALDVSVMDVSTLLKWCEKNSVDGVLNFNIDFAQRSHQALCEALGLPCYGTAEQYEVFTNKRLFKCACARSGVDVMEEYSLDDLEGIKYPVIVKPDASSGSRGVAVCATEDDLLNVLERSRLASRDGGVIVEKYMEGCPDIEIVYLVRDGEPHLLYVGDRYMGRGEDGLGSQCACFVVPSDHTGLFISAAHQRISNMIRSVGLKDAPLFFQGFVDGSVVRLFDPGLRFPGDEFGSVVKSACGIDLMSAFVRFALTGCLEFEGGIDDVCRLDGHRGALHMLSGHPGTIAQFDGLEKVRRLPFVVDAVQKKFVGDVVAEEGDVASRRIGEVAILTTGELGQLQKDIERCNGLMRVRSPEGANLLCDPVELASRL